MKKAILALFIMLLIIAGGVWEQFYIRRATGTLRDMLTELVVAIDNGEDMKQPMHDINDYWKSTHRTMEALVSHNEIREIHVKLGEIQGFVDTDRPDDARAVAITLIEITEYTEHLLEYRAEHIF